MEYRVRACRRCDRDMQEGDAIGVALQTLRPKPVSALPLVAVLLQALPILVLRHLLAPLLDERTHG
jgi:hypothetical protein